MAKPYNTGTGLSYSTKDRQNILTVTIEQNGTQLTLNGSPWLYYDHERHSQEYIAERIQAWRLAENATLNDLRGRGDLCK